MVYQSDEKVSKYLVLSVCSPLSKFTEHLKCRVIVSDQDIVQGTDLIFKLPFPNSVQSKTYSAWPSPIFVMFLLIFLVTTLQENDLKKILFV